MVDLVLTPANIIASGTATVVRGTAGAAIVAGQVVYKEAATGKYKLADSNSPTAEVKAAGGLALNGAADGQPLGVCTAGVITMGAVLTAGSAYYLSETPGGIQPAADLASEDIVQLGLAESTTVLNLRIQIPGVTLA